MKGWKCGRCADWRNVTTRLTNDRSGSAVSSWACEAVFVERRRGSWNSSTSERTWQRTHIDITL